VPEVSVVVPTRDRSGLLRTTLWSLLAQRNVDLEVIVVDDGSMDATADVVVSLGDTRVRMVRNVEPQGLSRARNRGIMEATGRWISFCDDDDVWAPSKLEKQLAAAHRLGRDWAYSGVVNIDGDLRPVSVPPVLSPDEVVAQLPRYNPIPGGGSNVVVRRRLLDLAGPFDPGLRALEDWEMSLRLSRLGPPAVAEHLLVGYRLHAGNMSLDVARILVSVRRIEQLHAIRVDHGRLHRWLAESCLRTGHRGEALRHWALAALAGETKGVGSDLRKILRRRLPRKRTRLTEPEWASEANEWLYGLAAYATGPVTQ
jgi:glycosyltransferase involved in cell wall biosynthesis